MQTARFPQADQVAKTDSFRPASFGLVILIGLFVLVWGWLFFGRITFYDYSTDVQTTTDNLIRATFASDQLTSDASTQPVQIEYLNADGELLTASAIVVNIFDNEENGTQQLDALVTDRDAYLNLFANFSELQQVGVTRRHVSPIQFIFTNAGLVE